LSQIALGEMKEAASDLDSAVQIEPLSLTAWTSRGLAYERLGDKEKAAGSYAKALNINKEHDPAKKGFARVGGKAGQTYQTF
jgi:Tfp pilus assembly protein PilF